MAKNSKYIDVVALDKATQQLKVIDTLNNGVAHLFMLDQDSNVKIRIKDFFEVLELISENNDWLRQQLKIDLVRHKVLSSNEVDALQIIVCSNDQEVIDYSYKKLKALHNAFNRIDTLISKFFAEKADIQNEYRKFIEWLSQQDYTNVLWSNIEDMCFNDFSTIGQFMKLYMESSKFLDEYSLFEMYGASENDFDDFLKNKHKRIVLF